MDRQIDLLPLQQVAIGFFANRQQRQAFNLPASFGRLYAPFANQGDHLLQIGLRTTTSWNTPTRRRSAGLPDHLVSVPVSR